MNKWMNSRADISKSIIATFDIIFISQTHILDNPKETQTLISLQLQELKENLEEIHSNELSQP